MKKQVNKLEANAAATKRWRTRLKRAMSMLDKLERQRKRLETATTKPKAEPVRINKRTAAMVEAFTGQVQPEPAAVQASIPAYPTVDSETTLGALPPAHPRPDDDLAIPTFLQRKKLDPVAAEIKAEQEATKKAKAKGRIEKMKAKQRGDLKKMPLVGKAALEMIRNG